MNAQKLLIGYSAVLTAVIAVALLSGAAPLQQPGQPLKELDVQRINIREPDGTLRMTISGEERMPGVIIKGREFPTPKRGVAGMIFFNAEGSETGGLIFSGRDEKGKAVSSGSLTFDRYEQDQVVQILETENGDRRFAGLLVSDRPDGRLDFQRLEEARSMPSGPARRAAFAAANAGEAHRIVLGRQADKSSEISLLDAKGRNRLVLKVTEAGAASIKFLDEQGKPVKTVTPE